MTATLVVNADLGSYSGALGAAQRLLNGDYSFTLGENGSEPPLPPAHTVEVTPNGTKVYDLKASRPEFRSFRIETLYQGTDLPMGNGRTPAGGGLSAELLDAIAMSIGNASSDGLAALSPASASAWQFPEDAESTETHGTDGFAAPISDDGPDSGLDIDI